MQSVAMQTKKNEQAAVLSLMAPSSYFWLPGWMLGGGAPPTALPGGLRPAAAQRAACTRLRR